MTDILNLLIGFLNSCDRIIEIDDLDSFGWLQFGTFFINCILYLYAFGQTTRKHINETFQICTLCQQFQNFFPFICFISPLLKCLLPFHNNCVLLFFFFFKYFVRQLFFISVFLLFFNILYLFFFLSNGLEALQTWGVWEDKTSGLLLGDGNE